MRSFIKIEHSFLYLGFIVCLKFPDFLSIISSFPLTKVLKICFSYGTFEASTNFPNHGVINICLDLIGQKA